MSDVMPERTELERSWTAILGEIAALSDAMRLDNGDWSEADECTLEQEFDPWVVIREAKKRASAWEADRKERDELRRRVIERLERNRELNAQIEALAKEIKVDDELLAERDRLLDAIPACEAHGNRCVPHAIEWVRAALAAKEER